MYQPNAKIERLVDAAVEPLTLAQAKKFLRVEVTDDDDLIADFITAARIRCEQIADRSFITTTWQYTIDFLPSSGLPAVNSFLPFNQYGNGGPFNRVSTNDGAVFLPFPPLIAVTSLIYINQAGTPTTMDVTPSAGNVIVSAGTPGKIYPAYNNLFPISQARPQSVTIVYTSGYGPDYTYVPKNIMAAMRFLLAFMYEHRSDDAPTPRIVEDMLSPVDWGGYA